MRISVVIPAYNAERWVGGAIGSALAQVPAPHEVIVVDDGSTDGTSAILAGYGGAARVVRQRNAGLAAARNAGAAAASGAWLFFLDADDELLPGALAALEEAVGRYPGADVIIPNFLRCDPEAAELEGPPARPRRDALLDRDDLIEVLGGRVLGANALVRAGAWREVPYRDGMRECEDLDLWVRLLLAGRRIVLLGSPLVATRVGRPGSLSSDLARMRAGRRTVLEDVWLRRDLRLSERLRVGLRLARAVAAELAVSRGAPSPRPSSRAGATLAALMRLPGLPRLAQALDPARQPAGAGGLDIHQVLLDEPGGGATHVGLLERRLGDTVIFDRSTVDPSLLRGDPLGWLRAWRRLLAATRYRPGVIHAHGVRAGLAALPVARLRGAGLVVTIHGLHSLRATPSPSRATLFANRLVLRAADAVLVMSQDDLETVQRHRLARPDRVRTTSPIFEPPVPLERATARELLGVPTDAVVLLWLGRLETEKDPSAFIRALERMEPGSAVAIIAGEGSLRPALEARASRSPVDIRFSGWCDPGTAMGAADVFVSTSRWEGVPIASLEAASVGLPIVATAVPGNLELRRRGVPVVLVPPADPDALAEALALLISEPTYRTQLAHATAEAVSGAFPQDGALDGLLEVYRALAGKGCG